MSPGPRTSVPGWEETVAQQEAAGSAWLVAFRWQGWPSAKAQWSLEYRDRGLTRPQGAHTHTQGQRRKRRAEQTSGQTERGLQEGKIFKRSGQDCPEPGGGAGKTRTHTHVDLTTRTHPFAGQSGQVAGQASGEGVAGRGAERQCARTLPPRSLPGTGESRGKPEWVQKPERTS